MVETGENKQNCLGSYKRAREIRPAIGTIFDTGKRITDSKSVLAESNIGVEVAGYELADSLVSNWLMAL